MADTKPATISVLLIPADITVKCMTVELPKQPGRAQLEAMYRLIDCRTVEATDLQFGPADGETDSVTVWSDEDGFAQELTNARATMLMRGGVYMAPWGVKGNVLVTGTKNGDAASVPDTFVQGCEARGWLQPGIGVPGGGLVSMGDWNEAR